MKKLFLILSVCLIAAIGCREGYLSEKIGSSASKSGEASSDKSALAGEFETETGKDNPSVTIGFVKQADFTIR